VLLKEPTVSSTAIVVLSASKLASYPGLLKLLQVNCILEDSMGKATGWAIFQVADVDKYLEVFKGKRADDWRKEHGVVCAQVFRFPDDPTKVGVCAEYPSLEVMQAFMASMALPDYRELMKDAGVQAPPTTFQLEEIYRTS
jgi:quinol monooxygenase YgiN